MSPIAAGPVTTSSPIAPTDRSIAATSWCSSIRTGPRSSWSNESLVCPESVSRSKSGRVLVDGIPLSEPWTIDDTGPDGEWDLGSR